MKIKATSAQVKTIAGRMPFLPGDEYLGYITSPLTFLGYAHSTASCLLATAGCIQCVIVNDDSGSLGVGLVLRIDPKDTNDLMNDTKELFRAITQIKPLSFFGKMRVAVRRLRIIASGNTSTNLFEVKSRPFPDSGMRVLFEWLIRNEVTSTQYRIVHIFGDSTKFGIVFESKDLEIMYNRTSK
jgi:hypothetical protein